MRRAHAHLSVPHKHQQRMTLATTARLVKSCEGEELIGHEPLTAALV